MRVPAIHRFLFHYQAQDDGVLPPTAGSAWRGAFGHALKKHSCIHQRRSDCNACPLRTGCPYTCVFEPAAVADAPRQYQQPAPGYVFAPLRGGAVKAGEIRQIELRLFGSTLRYAPFAIHALDNAARQGIGSARIRFHRHALQQWHDGDWRECMLSPDEASVPPMPQRIGIRLLSPLRIKHQGHALTPASLKASTFLMAVLRRCFLIHLGNGQLAEPDWSQWQQRAATATLEIPQLQWQELARHSSRQGRMQAGGIVGSMELHGLDESFWPLLWAGQWLHLGHMACMGFGAYRIEAV